MTTPPFDLDVACAHVARRDRTLARLMREIGPCRLEIAPRQSPYEALFESIVYQQLTGQAAATIHKRVLKLFGSRRCPRPAAVAEASLDRLRSAGLSRNKAEALRDLARHALEGTIPTRAKAEKLGDEEIVEQLTAVRGVGRWTVEMFLIFTLGRPDVLPLADYGIKKGFASTFGRRVLPKPKELADHGDLWRPYRTVASWYLWRATDAA
ncbi:MAG TPA: DNA-3-methyladenine glycosylase [Thermoanaerobaculia bacterium]|nr:DNA-3-methyladenine glycosylase [Thermoanaerobaculia bacterium]